MHSCMYPAKHEVPVWFDADVFVEEKDPVWLSNINDEFVVVVEVLGTGAAEGSRRQSFVVGFTAHCAY